MVLSTDVQLRTLKIFILCLCICYTASLLLYYFHMFIPLNHVSNILMQTTVKYKI